MLSLLARVLSLALNVLLAYYVWRRLVRDTNLPRPWRHLATATIVVMQLLVGLTFWAGRAGWTDLQGALAWPAFLWFALFALTFVAIGLFDIARLLLWALPPRSGVAQRVRARLARSDPKPREAIQIDHGRRELLARITGGAALVAATGQVAYGAIEVLGDHRVVDVEIPLARLPAGFDGFTIVQLTDLHVGMTVGRGFVAGVVERVNVLAPDLVVLTGDIVDGPHDDLVARIDPFADLRAPHGVFSVTGNHEYYSGVDAWLDAFRARGVRPLRNQRVELRHGDDVIDLAGIDDHSAHRFGRGHGADLTAALDGRDPRRCVILLAHQPRQVRVAAAHEVDLQLSGHTHGGQIWPWHHIVSIQQGGLLAGRYRIDATELYVSRGVGHWGPPVRVGAPAEITRIILRAST